MRIKSKKERKKNPNTIQIVMNSVKQCSLSTNVIFKEQYGENRIYSLLASFKTSLTRKENLPPSSDFIQPVV